MTLTARLDRLRGRPSQPDGEVPMASLQRLRDVPAPTGRRPALSAALRHDLHVDHEHDGLFFRDRRCSLPERSADAVPLSMLPAVCDLTACDWVYLDTETSGLSGGVGNLAFMVGAARCTAAGDLAIRQWLLGCFGAEAAMLRDLVDWIGRDAVLVSYNGKSFDLPVLSGRLAMQRIDHPLAGLRHLDLMHDVRRAYRNHWPDCRLQTAERQLLGLYRQDDLPGAEAPAAWRAWMARGVTGPLRRVLQHNLQDVASLALLHHRLVDDYAGSSLGGVDHAAIARAWQNAGHTEYACRVLERAGGTLDDTGLLQLAGLYRRRGVWTKAVALWQELYRRGCSIAAGELSKYYEHRVRDYPRAVGFAKGCGIAERRVRVARLRSKIGGSLPLPW